MKRIKPGTGIDNDADYWRLSYQLARGVSEIHQHGLNRFDIRVRCRSICFNAISSLSNSDPSYPPALHRPKTHC